MSKVFSRSAIPNFKLTLDKQKSFFLDRPRWRGILDASERDALMFSGGYIRKVAKNSMRRRKGPSTTEQSPTVWSGLLKQLIFFHLDTQTGGEDQNSVIVGPSYVPGVAEKQGVTYLSAKTIPRTLEIGGTETKQDSEDRFLDPVNRIQWVNVELPPRTFRVQGRHYMNRSMKKSAPYILRYFRNMRVRGSVGIQGVK
jgi:hypothetical protein